MTAPDDRPTRGVPNAIQRIANLGNVSAALIGLGASIALAFLLPPSLYKVTTGAAAIVAVLSIATLVYRRTNVARPAADDTSGR